MNLMLVQYLTLHTFFIFAAKFDKDVRGINDDAEKGRQMDKTTEKRPTNFPPSLSGK